MLLCPTPQLRATQISSAANHIGFFSYQLGSAVSEEHNAKATFRLGQHQFTHVRRTDSSDGSAEIKIQKVFWQKGQAPKMLNEALAKITTQEKQTGITLTKAANYRHRGLVKAELEYSIAGSFRKATLSRSHQDETRTLVIQVAPDVSVTVFRGAEILSAAHQDSWQVEHASNILCLASGSQYGLLGLNTIFEWIQTPDRIALHAKKTIEPAQTFSMVDLIMFAQQFFIQGQTTKTAMKSKKQIYQSPAQMIALNFLRDQFKSTALI
jgi:hypothetical protein